VLPEMDEWFDMSDDDADDDNEDDEDAGLLLQ
jgi:hypothetical protein